jgi:hypothetical protein
MARAEAADIAGQRPMTQAFWIVLAVLAGGALLASALYFLRVVMKTLPAEDDPRQQGTGLHFGVGADFSFGDGGHGGGGGGD